MTHFTTDPADGWRTLMIPCSWRGLFLFKHTVYMWFIAIFPPFYKLSSIPPPHYLLSTFLLLPTVFHLPPRAEVRKSRSWGIWTVHEVKVIPPPSSVVNTWAAEAYEVQWQLTATCLLWINVPFTFSIYPITTWLLFFESSYSDPHMFNLNLQMLKHNQEHCGFLRLFSEKQ